MKKIYTLFFASISAISAFGTQYNIITSGTTYSPSTINAMIGDTITIAASSVHPLVQVDQATWNANGNTPLAGGWGTKTSAYTFTVDTAGTVYFVCQNHVTMGMKGMIVVSAASGLASNVAFTNSLELFPNPAKNSFQLNFQLAVSAKTQIKLYDIYGKELITLMDGTNLGSGDHELKFAIPENIANGAYIVSLVYDDKAINHRLIIEK